VASGFLRLAAAAEDDLLTGSDFLIAFGMAAGFADLEALAALLLDLEAEAEEEDDEEEEESSEKSLLLPSSSKE
jgi:hypothetical protein